MDLGCIINITEQLHVHTWEQVQFIFLKKQSNFILALVEFQVS